MVMQTVGLGDLVLLHVYVNQSRVASIRVPRNRQARSVAWSSVAI
jgi:hypothetical protein